MPDELLRRRRELAMQLSHSDDEHFIRMLWTLNALQTGRSEHAYPYLLQVPKGADTMGILGPHAIYPWELETLGNELLATPKHSLYRLFDTRHWPVIAQLVNGLRAVENAEYGARREDLNIFREMSRIGARQFEWQRGFFTSADLYRSAFIYGQGDCADYLEQSAGFSVADITLVGFALMTAFMPRPIIWPDRDLTIMQQFGLTSPLVQRVIKRIAQPASTLRAEAAKLRQAGDAVAYKPSILRRFPCILMGPRNRRMYAPLPDLIGSRVTSGLFYDTIDGGGPIRAETGRRFEAYGHALISATLPALNVEREWSYNTPAGRYDTPDILAVDADDVTNLAIECKAARMSINARFGENPHGERGYEEIAKGVFQLWRFFSHCRLGLTGRSLSPDVMGLILTLDEWFVASGQMIDGVIVRAHALADGHDPPIIQEDRRPVAFCSISELETTLTTATEQSFMGTVALASGERRGWVFFALHNELDAPKVESRPYPFYDGIGELLPWFTEMDAMEG